MKRTDGSSPMLIAAGVAHGTLPAENQKNKKVNLHRKSALLCAFSIVPYK
jgi:hypothetical protein